MTADNQQGGAALLKVLAVFALPCIIIAVIVAAVIILPGQKHDPGLNGEGNRTVQSPDAEGSESWTDSFNPYSGKPRELAFNRTGSISVNAGRDGAEIRIDGVPVGVTPAKIDNIDAGWHRLEVSKADILWSQNIYVRPNTIKKVFAHLEKTETGIYIETSPAYAEITIDGKYMGLSPLRITGLSQKQHRLVIHKDRYYDSDGTFFARTGEEDHIKVTLEGGNLVKFDGRWVEPDVRDAFLKHKKAGGSKSALRKGGDDPGTPSGAVRMNLVPGDHPSSSTPPMQVPLEATAVQAPSPKPRSRPLTISRIEKEQYASGDRYVTNGVVAYDSTTNLLWEVKTSKTSSRRYTLDEATRYCDTLVLDGHRDWRLPTKAELASIVEKGSSPRVDEEVFPECCPALYWSSTRSDIDKNKAFCIDFRSGMTKTSAATEEAFARAVREMK